MKIFLIFLLFFIIFGLNAKGPRYHGFVKKVCDNGREKVKINGEIITKEVCITLSYKR